MMLSKSSRYFLLLIFLMMPISAFAETWNLIERGIQYIKIDAADVENRLWQHLESFSDTKFQARDKYIYQYQFTGENRIKIFALCAEWENANLRKDFLVIFNGGSCYFFIEYNYKNHRFSKLQINEVTKHVGNSAS